MNQLIYQSTEKMIKYFDAHPEFKLNFVWSTPSVYMDTVNALNLTWSIKNGDFFPYCSDPHSCWTGYYTSRANLKGYAREMNNLAHTVDKAISTSSLTGKEKSEAKTSLEVLDDAYGVIQHHDAIAGTEKQVVAFDYAKRLGEGQNIAYDVLSRTLSKAMLNQTDATFQFCPLMNESSCPALDNMGTDLTMGAVFYNPLGQEVQHRAVLSITTNTAEVKDAQGNAVDSSVLPDMEHDGKFHLFFTADIPALGYTTYFISMKPQVKRDEPLADQKVLQNKYYTITFGDDNRISSIKSSTTQMDLTQSYLTYAAQSSGAYIFRPTGPATNFPNPDLKIQTSAQVQEAHQVWGPWLTHTIRLHEDSPFIEFTSTVSPMQDLGDAGKELIFRFNSSLSTNGLWYTDSQGLEMMRRVRDKRPEWPQGLNYDNGGEPESFNYVPINEAARLSDGKTDITIITDRSRGCASLFDGSFEVMLQRRLLRDDGLGVAEALDENITVTGTIYLSISETKESGRLQREKSLAVNNPPTLAFSNVPSKAVLTYSFLTVPLPPQIHLLNLRTIGDDVILMRLHHVYASDEGELSVPVTMDIAKHFGNWNIASIVETQLTANQNIKTVKRMEWKKEATAPAKFKSTPLKGTIINIRPMDTRTLIVNLRR